MTFAKKAAVAAAFVILCSPFAAHAQSESATGGGAEGSTSSVTGQSRDGMMKKDGMTKKDGMMKKDSMKSNGTSSDHKM